jgi:hypothetical protein
MKYKCIAVVILIWVIISASAIWLYFGNEKKLFVFMEGKALGVFYANLEPMRCPMEKAQQTPNIDS